jgi:hypothetical protein
VDTRNQIIIDIGHPHTTQTIARPNLFRTTPPLSVFSKITPSLETSLRHRNPTPTYLDHNGCYPRLHAHLCSFVQPKEASKRDSCSRHFHHRKESENGDIKRTRLQKHLTHIPSQLKPRNHSDQTQQTSKKKPYPYRPLTSNHRHSPDPVTLKTP